MQKLTMQKLKQIPMKWRWAGLSILILFVGYMRYRYVHSPEYVLNQTFAALERHDAETLVSLTSPKERETLNMTPKTVESYLQSIYYKNPNIHPKISYSSPTYPYANVLEYPINISGFPKSQENIHFHVTMYQTSDGKWHFNLSELLYLMPKICDGETGDHALIWDKMAQNAGIKGVISATGGFRTTDAEQHFKFSLFHD